MQFIEALPIIRGTTGGENYEINEDWKLIQPG